MKYLGIDFGTKRIGIATSDQSGEFAFPKKIIPNGPQAVAEIMELITVENIEKIVIGNSITSSGDRNSVMKHVDQFVDQLKSQLDIPIAMQDERFSSMMARSMDRQKSDLVDDRAAALLLQRYLDIENPSKD